MPLLYEEINVLIYGMNLLKLLIFTYKCSDKKCFHIKMLSGTRPHARSQLRPGQATEVWPARSISGNLGTTNGSHAVIDAGCDHID